MLECDFCGCDSPKHDTGWVTYPDDDAVSGARDPHLLPTVRLRHARLLTRCRPRARLRLDMKPETDNA
jgi:hypothetical protein